MFPISPICKIAMKSRIREWMVKVEVNDQAYYSTHIVEFKIKSDIISADDFEIGTVIADELSISLRSVEVPSGAVIRPYVALSLNPLTWEQIEEVWDNYEHEWENGQTEWMPLGEFVVDSRSKNNGYWTYTCLSKLVYSNTEHISSLSYPTTMQALWDEICDDLDYSYDSSVNINPSLTVPIAPTGYSKRNLMSYIASAHSTSVIVGKNRLIKWVKFKHDNSSVYEVFKSDYLSLVQTNPRKEIKAIDVKVDEETTIHLGAGNESDSIYFENPMVSESTLEGVLDDINGIKITPCTIRAKGFPHLEVGDVIRIQRDISERWDSISDSWEDLDIRWDGTLEENTIITSYELDYKGGLFMTINSKIKSEQESEIKVDGSLTTQLKRLDKVAIKETRKYYGVSITKEDGIKIDRSDNAFGALFNADTLKFTADGENALWFDIPNGEFMFSGTVTASKILGSYIRTNPGNYPYCEMSSDDNVFKAAKASDSYYEIEASPASYSSPLVKHVYNSVTMYAGIASGAYFTSVVNGGYDISVANVFRVTASNIVLNNPTQINSNLTVTAGGSIYVNSASDIYLGTTPLSTYLGNYVSYSTYLMKVSQIESRLSALESA